MKLSDYLWAGWYRAPAEGGRKKRKWVLAALAEDEAGAWEPLFHMPAGDKMVLPTERGDPNGGGEHTPQTPPWLPAEAVEPSAAPALRQLTLF